MAMQRICWQKTSEAQVSPSLSLTHFYYPFLHSLAVSFCLPGFLDAWQVETLLVAVQAADLMIFGLKFTS